MGDLACKVLAVFILRRKIQGRTLTNSNPLCPGTALLLLWCDMPSRPAGDRVAPGTAARLRIVARGAVPPDAGGGGRPLDNPDAAANPAAAGVYQGNCPRCTVALMLTLAFGVGNLLGSPTTAVFRRF